MALCSVAVVALLIAGVPGASAQECNAPRTQHGDFNLGNHGGCWLCAANSQEDLVELCKATCQADPNCRAYEYAQPAIHPYYEATTPSGRAINCCIEHVTIDNFQNPVSYETATGNCKNEASCWSTVGVSASCSRTTYGPAQCVRDPSNFGYSEDIAGLRRWVANNCLLDNNARAPTCEVGAWAPPPSTPPPNIGPIIGGVVGGCFVPVLMCILWLSGVFARHGCPSPLKKKPPPHEGDDRRTQMSSIETASA